MIERVEFDEDTWVLVAHVRPRSRERGRCGICWRRSPGYDAGPGRRRWRTLDLGTIQAFVEADAPRVRCKMHGVVVDLMRIAWRTVGSIISRVWADADAAALKASTGSGGSGLTRSVTRRSTST